MSHAGSIGTSRGMRMWYARKPKCRHCPKVNSKGKALKPKVLFKYDSPDIGMCAGCFKKITGESLSEQYWIYHKLFKGTTRSDYINWLKEKIKSHGIQGS